MNLLMKITNEFMEGLKNKIIELTIDKTPKVVEVKENLNSKIVNLVIDKKPKIH